MGLYNQIKHNIEVMSLTIPEDKRKLIEKECKALSERVHGRSVECGHCVSRGAARAKGRGNQIEKQTCHITVKVGA